MISEQQANYSLNIGLHVLMLFTFLTVLFFVIIVSKEKESINNAMNNVINKQIPKLLDGINDINKKYNIGTIDWTKLNILAENVYNNSQGDSQETIDNNNRLKWVSIIIIITLTVILLGLFLYYKFILKFNITIKRIIGENIVIFIFIGIIEYVFFMSIASKYIPTTNELVSNTIFDSIKKRIQSELKK